MNIKLFSANICCDRILNFTIYVYAENIDSAYEYIKNQYSKYKNKQVSISNLREIIPYNGMIIKGA